MSRRRRRRWPWILVILAAGAGGGWWYWTHREQKAAAPEYETATVTRGDVTQVVLASGELNPLTKVEIGSQISGTISKLNVDFNSKVKEGDVLCELDPATYDAAYNQTVAEQASAQADLQLQQRTLERKLQLMKKDFFAKADFDKAQADLSHAEAQLQLADARVKKAKVDLDRCKIVAPIDGVVVDRTADIGQTIAASFNAPKLFVLANDLTKMQINAKVSEADVGEIAVGQKVSFRVDAYTDTFLGEVVQVRNSPIKEENIVNYDCIIDVNNPDLKLKPGMTATVSVTTGDRKGVIRVPNAALRFKPSSKDGGRSGGPPPGIQMSARTKPVKTDRPTDQRQVYFLPTTPTGDPVPVTIKTGLRDAKQTEVLSGLKEGDVVITLLKPTVDDSSGITNPFGGPGGRRGGR